jgi:hypothetical protein
MKRPLFVFSLIVAAAMPALAGAQVKQDETLPSDIPEVDVIFKCHEDPYTMEAAAGGLAGKLAKRRDRVYGVLLYPSDSRFAYVTAPYKISGPAFFEQEGVKFACVTVQSVKSLSAVEPKEDSTDAETAELPASSEPVDTSADIAPEPAIDVPAASEEPVFSVDPISSQDDVNADDKGILVAPGAALPDFSGVHDGDVFGHEEVAPAQDASPVDPIDDEQVSEPADAPAPPAQEQEVAPATDAPAVQDPNANSAPALAIPSAPEASQVLEQVPAEDQFTPSPVSTPDVIDPNLSVVAAPAAPMAPVPSDAPSVVPAEDQITPPPVDAPVSLDPNAGDVTISAIPMAPIPSDAPNEVPAEEQMTPPAVAATDALDPNTHNVVSPAIPVATESAPTLSVQDTNINTAPVASADAPTDAQPSTIETPTDAPSQDALGPVVQPVVPADSAPTLDPNGFDVANEVPAYADETKPNPVPAAPAAQAAPEIGADATRNAVVEVPAFPAAVSPTVIGPVVTKAPAISVEDTDTDVDAIPTNETSEDEDTRRNNAFWAGFDD